MLQCYLNNINHNRYLKINYKNFYNYAKLNNLNILIKFKTNINNNKFIILCIFFLFKDILLKNGYFIILNKKTKKLIGIKFILKNTLMYNFLNFLISNFINQPEIQNNIKLLSFDTCGNYTLVLPCTSYYYFEKFIFNKNFKKILQFFDINVIFNFNNFCLLDHIFYLNFFKFYFYDSNKYNKAIILYSGIA